MLFTQLDAGCDQQATIVGQRLTELATLTVVARCCQQQTDDCRLIRLRLATADVQWPNFLSPEFGTKLKFLERSTLIIAEILISLSTCMQTSSIRAAVSIYRVAQKIGTIFVHLIFTKLFHCQNQKNIVIIPSGKISPYLNCVATLPYEMSCLKSKLKTRRLL